MPRRRGRDRLGRPRRRLARRVARAEGRAHRPRPRRSGCPSSPRPRPGSSAPPTSPPTTRGSASSRPGSPTWPTPSAAGDPNPALDPGHPPGHLLARPARSRPSPSSSTGGACEAIAPEVPVAATVAVVELAGGDGAARTPTPSRDALEDAGWARGDERRPRPYAEAGRDGRPALALEGSDHVTRTHRRLARRRCVALALLAAACSEADDGGGDGGRARPRRPGRLHRRRPVGVAREARPAHPPGPGLQRQRRRGRRRVRLRPRAVEVVGRRRPAPRRRAGTRTREGPRPVIWSPAASTWGAVLNERLAAQGDAGHDRRLRVVPAHPARDRDAPPDGRGARLARGAARLRRHPRPLPGPGRAGPRTATPSGVRSSSARPTRTSPPAGCRRSSRRPTPPTARPRACRSRTSPSRPPTSSPGRSSRPSSTTATRR